MSDQINTTAPDALAAPVTHRTPSVQDQRIAARLAYAQTLFDALQNETELRDLLAGHGYTAEKIAEGVGLLTAAESGYALRQHQIGARQLADAALTVQYRNVRARYVALRRSARALFAAEGTRTAMGLSGKLARKLEQFIPLATLTYNTILANPAYRDLLVVYGYPTARLQAEKQALDNLVTAVQTVAAARNQAVLATRAREDAMQDLTYWLVRFRSIAADATADRPDLAAKLNV